ncbi:MAG: hypothetical protein K0R73_1002 [Candidatus Midichloriaceae bacterium]|jgi:hypothetical protein|nr:hypothetical protein [Candidatus Midichloriaceae bacterium]
MKSTQNLSHSNLAGYEKSGWIERVGSGAFKRVADDVSWEGALYELQNQHPGIFHIGGCTAVEFSGAAHFIPMCQARVFLFFNARKGLPLWFGNYTKSIATELVYLQYSILPTTWYHSI